MRRDDIFTKDGITWQSFWLNGTCVWRAHGRRLEAWRCGWARHERIDDNGEVHDEPRAEYVSTIDGAVVARDATLLRVMDRASLEFARNGGRIAA